MCLIKIYLPFYFKIIIIKNNTKIKNNYKIKIINKNYELNLNLKNLNYLFFDKWNNNLLLKYNKIKTKPTKEINKFNNLMKSLIIYFYKKIKFKGKGFRIKSFKKTKIIKFFFGKSHKTFILINKLKKMRVNKYKYLVFGINNNKIMILKKFLDKIKNYNIYTLRGLRFSKQIIYKRKGKKGTYI